MGNQCSEPLDYFAKGDITCKKQSQAEEGGMERMVKGCRGVVG